MRDGIRMFIKISGKVLKYWLKGTKNDKNGFTVTGVSILKFSATCMACTKPLMNSIT